ncbi:MAG: transglutaminase domain-containing protein, partial [Bacteroidota bacterium]
MFKTHFSFLFLFLCSSFLLAQELSREWGRVGPAEFNLNSYDKDPEAEALILYDIGKSWFEDDGTKLVIKFTRRKRIKILTEAGKAYADIFLRYYTDGYGKSEIIKGIDAIAYNVENGELVSSQLTNGSVFDEVIGENWKAKKFAIPNVKVGTVLEFKYELETPFFYNLPDWRFQDRIPTLFSSYTVKMIPFYEYSFLGQGITKADQKEVKADPFEKTYAQVKYKDMIYTFEKKDVPAFKDESYITSVNDYIMKIDFQLARVNHPRGGSREIATTWPKLVDQMRRSDGFGKYISKSKKIAEKVLEQKLPITGMSDLHKAQNIITYVKNSYEWDGNMGKYAMHSPKEFHETGVGNVGDINLFLVALLRAAGIDATPVISSTRSHGKIKSNYPFVHFFNYTLVWVKVGNASFLTDATSPLLANNRIPPRCINYLGLAINEEEGEWLDLESKNASLNRKIIRTVIDPAEMTAKTSLSMQLTDFEAYLFRAEFQNDTEKMHDRFLKEGFDDIAEIKSMNYDKLRSPYILQVEGESTLGQLGENLVVRPFLNFPIQNNELTQKERTYPIDMIFARSDEFLISVNIPEGYKI